MTEQVPVDALAKVRAGLDDGEEIVLTTFAMPQSLQGGRGMTWVWALPFLWLWRRRERRRVATEGGQLLGIVLPRPGFLVVTDRRLMVWSMDKVGRRRRHLGELVAQVDRSQVAALRNDTVGQGWRGCTMTMVGGGELVLRVPAFKVEALLECFSPPREQYL